MYVCCFYIRWISFYLVVVFQTIWLSSYRFQVLEGREGKFCNEFHIQPSASLFVLWSDSECIMLIQPNSPCTLYIVALYIGDVMVYVCLNWHEAIHLLTIGQ